MRHSGCTCILVCFSSQHRRIPSRLDNKYRLVLIYSLHKNVCRTILGIFYWSNLWNLATCTDFFSRFQLDVLTLYIFQYKSKAVLCYHFCIRLHLNCQLTRIKAGNLFWYIRVNCVIMHFYCNSGYVTFYIQIYILSFLLFKTSVCLLGMYWSKSTNLMHYLFYKSWYPLDNWLKVVESTNASVWLHHFLRCIAPWPSHNPVSRCVGVTNPLLYIPPQTKFDGI